MTIAMTGSDIKILHTPLTILLSSYNIQYKLLWFKLTCNKNWAILFWLLDNHLLIGTTSIRLFLKVIVSTGTDETFSIG